MTTKLPYKLSNDTIMEGVFEIWFDSVSDSTGDLLPGLLYPDFKSDLPGSEPLVVPFVPREMLRTDPNLKHRPIHRLVGSQYILGLGYSVATLSCKRPYVGWGNFRPMIVRVLEALHRTGQISKVQRFSIKYANLIKPEGADSQLSQLNLQFKVASLESSQRGFFFRSEVPHNKFLSIVTIATEMGMVDATTGHVETGLLLDIDTICEQPFGDFLKEIGELLDAAHLTEKEIFFTLLSEKTLNRLGPIWAA